MQENHTRAQRNVVLNENAMLTLSMFCHRCICVTVCSVQCACSVLWYVFSPTLHNFSSIIPLLFDSSAFISPASFGFAFVSKCAKSYNIDTDFAWPGMPFNEHLVKYTIYVELYHSNMRLACAKWCLKKCYVSIIKPLRSIMWGVYIKWKKNFSLSNLSNRMQIHTYRASKYMYWSSVMEYEHLTALWATHTLDGEG